MRKTTLVATLATTLMLGSIPVSAQPSGTAMVVPAQWGEGRAVQRDRFQQVYSQGYEAGVREGQRDARSRRGGDYRRNDDYRSGGRWNSRSAEADAYRRGFADGYERGFRQSQNGWGNGYPGQGYPDRGYPDRGYPGRDYPGGGYGRGGYGHSPAVERGFEDGYREGRDAARDNDRYDPVRERRYRDGDNGYNNRYGSRDEYKHEYRNAFRQGYDRGYREGRYR